MESNSKGVAWVCNIYQQFEDMCVEADDVLFQEALKYVENKFQIVGANVKQFCSELTEEVLPSSPTNSVEELNSALVQNAGATACESNTSGDEDHSQKELFCSSSLESVKDIHFGLSPDQSKEDGRALTHCSGSVSSSSVILAQACKNELQDITVDDTSLESKEEASNKSVSNLALEAVHVPSFDKAKLQESCIIVDRNEVQALSNEARERRSYKKKFGMPFCSDSRSAKRDNNKQHAGWSKEKGNEVGLFRHGVCESQDMEFCEWDWEII